MNQWILGINGSGLVGIRTTDIGSISALKVGSRFRIVIITKTPITKDGETSPMVGDIHFTHEECNEALKKFMNRLGLDIFI